VKTTNDGVFFTTIEKNDVYVPFDEDVEAVYCHKLTASRSVHWGWWVFWLIMFYPVLIITFLMSVMRKKHLVSISVGGETHVGWYSTKEFEKIVSIVDRK